MELRNRFDALNLEMSGPKDIMKELQRKVKLSACQDGCEMWEKAAFSVKKRAHDTCNFYQILKESTGTKAAVSKVVKDRSGRVVSCQKERLTRRKDHF